MLMNEVENYPSVLYHVAVQYQVMDDAE